VVCESVGGKYLEDPSKFSDNKETEQKLRTGLPEGMAFTRTENKVAKATKAVINDERRHLQGHPR
jgi:hypothetical protein